MGDVGKRVLDSDFEKIVNDLGNRTPDGVASSLPPLSARRVEKANNKEGWNQSAHVEQWLFDCSWS